MYLSQSESELYDAVETLREKRKEDKSPETSSETRSLKDFKPKSHTGMVEGDTMYAPRVAIYYNNMYERNDYGGIQWENINVCNAIKRLTKEKKYDIAKVVSIVNKSKSVKRKVKRSQRESYDLWGSIEKMRYYDKDEGGVLALRNLPYSVEEALFIFEGIESLLFNLKAALTDESLSSETADNPRNYHNFLCHVIFKGRSFYAAVVDHPSLCLYLDNNYHPIYDLLRQKAGV